ncbi:MAG: 50S ribosomal protein L13 [Patescibacteria group bacterium]
MKVSTGSTKVKQIKRTWHLIDVKSAVLGRVAVEIASKLMGKTKPYFVRSLDCGDFVVVINAKKVAVTGHKEKEKLYTKYSGYPGGLKTKFLWQVRSERPTTIIRRAVMGMLPKNKLRNRMITRLYIYADDKHPYNDKFIK